MHHPLIPFTIATHAKPTENGMVLAADMGGTKVNMALCSFNNGRPEIVQSAKFLSKDYSSIYEVIRTFLSDNDTSTPQNICIGAAGPVHNNHVDFTNLSWSIDAATIAKETGIQQVAIINDLEATAYGLACLQEDDFLVLQKGDVNSKGNMAIIAPGTGLGEAGMYFDGKAYAPFASEGGHSEFAPRTSQDITLLQYLQPQHGIVSWEHVASGLGIVNIFNFLRDVVKMEVPTWLSEALITGDDTVTISNAATQQQVPICITALQLFTEFVARETASLVVKFKATGGIFIGGGIPPKMKAFFQDPSFLAAYSQSDRMENLINAAPIKMILNDKAALLGAAYAAFFGIATNDNK